MRVSASNNAQNALAALIDLISRARRSETEAELDFLLLNESRNLAPYRQAVLWRQSNQSLAMSGLISVDKNAPYTLWVRQVTRYLAKNVSGAKQIIPSDLPINMRNDWAEWWPSHAIWIPAQDAESPNDKVGTIWLRDEPWREIEITLFTEWLQAWSHALMALNLQQRKRSLWRNLKSPKIRKRPLGGWLLLALISVLLILPVQLSVLSPGEIVPANPIDMRSPLDGVIDEILVRPNDPVEAGQLLWTFDRSLISSRLKVSEQALTTAQSTYRQASQKALVDSEVRAQLSQLQGQIRERQAEVDFLRDQVQRAVVKAPVAGIAFFDDASTLVGKPVQIGERVLRIATPGDSEIEGWLSLSDAIDLVPGSPVKLFLNARPLEPVQGTLRYVSQEASLRPDGQYAYRIRANLTQSNDRTIGLKGTLKLEGEKVSALYWVLRRPLASIRMTLGW